MVGQREYMDVPRRLATRRAPREPREAGSSVKRRHQNRLFIEYATLSTISQ